MISALIVAAGQGKRMGAALPKQYLALAGRPVLAWTLRAFDRVERIDQLILVVAADRIEYCRERIIKTLGLRHVVRLVPGGDERQASVAEGLQVIRDPDGIVLIHDGVRPMVSSSLIEACVDGALQWEACVPGLSPTDTLVQINPQGFVQSTLSRATLRQIQTPQAFRVGLIQRAHQLAVQNRWQTTDDAGLVVQMGIPVHVIPGEMSNLKITTAMDLIIADAWYNGGSGTGMQ